MFLSEQVTPLLRSGIRGMKTEMEHVTPLLEGLQQELGAEELRRRHPEAAGYLRDPEGYRLFDQRDRLIARLERDVSQRASGLEESARYPLVDGSDASTDP